MTHDPQDDWSADGICIRCDGYALISGNGPAKNGVTVSCEGDCGTFGAFHDGFTLVEYAAPAPAPRPISPPPPADFFGPDEPF